jgi:clan AA aspartic protease
MGLIRARITLSNPAASSLRPVDVEALVDTGALHLCIPEHVAVQLQLPESYKREVKTADGKVHLCSYVGPVRVTFQDRGCFTGALVLGDTVLLGAVPMEDMDLVVSPADQSVTVNPESPNIPSSTAM